MSRLTRCGVRSSGMVWRWHSVACMIAVSVVSGLGGCTIVDQFSSRAVNYNLEAEQAQEQALLLNIVRASLRRPMQFTSLQSITGTASASGTIGGGYGTRTRRHSSNFSPRRFRRR